MKKFLTLLTAVAFASTALFAEAATPRAAEDSTAAVAVSDAPVPKVRKATRVKSAKHVKATKHGKVKKVAHKRSTKGKKKKMRLARH